MTIAEDGTGSSIAFRPYQQECIQNVLKAYQEQPEGGSALVVLPTGCGKTIIFAEVARRLGLTTLIIAHREELLQQAAEKYRLIDPTVIIGQVGAGRHEWGAPVTVASIQTLSRPQNLEQLARFEYGLVIVDECRHSAAATYQSVLDALPKAFRLGVTATADRLDRLDITETFGQPVYSAFIRDMVVQNYLCDLRAIAVKTTASLDGLHTQAGDFKLNELEVLVDTPERNRRVAMAYVEHAYGRQALCFAVTVEHATHLAAAFEEEGIASAMVCGETPPETRKRILRDYERGQIEVLCNVGVLTEGYDAPATSCIIMARPTQSRALFTQCVGRGTRLAPGKKDCLILDITDNCTKHRLQPVTLSHMLDMPLTNDESFLEMLRLQQEMEMRFQKKERTLKKSHLNQNQEVDVFAADTLTVLDWRRLDGGIYMLKVREDCLKLKPSQEVYGAYEVWAFLKGGEPQCWLRNAPLDWALEHAERKARLMLADESKRVLFDLSAAWRNDPATEKQRQALETYSYFCPAGLSKGEAQLLIEQAKAAWRAEPATEKQHALLRTLGVAFEPLLTKGEASELIAQRLGGRAQGQRGQEWFPERPQA